MNSERGQRITPGRKGERGELSKGGKEKEDEVKDDLGCMQCNGMTLSLMDMHMSTPRFLFFFFRFILAELLSILFEHSCFYKQICFGSRVEDCHEYVN